MDQQQHLSSILFCFVLFCFTLLGSFCIISLAWFLHFCYYSSLRAKCITHYPVTQTAFPKEQSSQWEWPELVEEAAL